MTEEWAPFPADPRYEVSTEGRVRRADTGRSRKPVALKSGYLTFVTHLGGRHHCHYVHRAVVETFIGPIPKGMQVCHNDGNRANCRLGNLRIDTPAGNHSDRREHGTLTRGEQVHNSVLTEAQVVEIYESTEKSAAIADRLGVPRGQVNRIRRGENWGWLTSTLPPRPVMCGAITSEQVKDIYLSSLPGARLARDYSISQAAVSRIRNGKAWTEITATLNKEVA
ncbi:HNH endonuclease [Brevibacterium casei]